LILNPASGIFKLRTVTQAAVTSTQIGNGTLVIISLIVTLRVTGCYVNSRDPGLLPLLAFWVVLKIYKAVAIVQLHLKVTERFKP
jgi:hypothetical protein